jgi:hypothetical protein
MALLRRPVAELPPLVAPPAGNSTFRRYQACVDPGRLDLSRTLRHDVDRARPIGRRSVTELPGIVAAPTLDRSGAGERTGVVGAESDLLGTCEAAHGDGTGCVLLGSRGPAVPELAGPIRPPAAHASTCDGAGVTVADTEVGDAAETRHRHRGRALTLEEILGIAARLSISELPLVVMSPAQHLTADDGAGVTRSGNDHRGRPRQSSHFAGRQSVGGVPGPELAEGVPPPTAHDVHVDLARVVQPARHCIDPAGAVDDLTWERIGIQVARLPVPKLAVVVHTPTANR